VAATGPEKIKGTWGHNRNFPSYHPGMKATVLDRWHLSRPPRGAAQCPKHKGKVPSAEHGNGLQWSVRYRIADPQTGQLRQKRENFTKKSDADRRAAEVQTDNSRGQFIDPADAKIRFRDYAESWRAAQPHRHGTVASAEQNLRLHIYPTFGDRYIRTIRQTEVQGWLTGLTREGGGTLSVSTARLVFQKCKVIFNAAVADGIVTRSPCVGVKLPKLPVKKVVPLIPAQVLALAAAMPDRYRALVITGAGTGLRAGELYGLRVCDVDFLRRELHVEQQLQRRGDEVYACPPKTASSHRTVPLSSVVGEVLAAHLAAYPQPDREGLIFRNDKGGPINASRFYKHVLGPAVAAAGLPKGTGLHALRHFYASVLIAARESIKVVSERLGHTNAAMTLGVYAHLMPDTEESTRKAVDDALNLPSAPIVPSAKPSVG
jgi:integrase